MKKTAGFTLFLLALIIAANAVAADATPLSPARQIDTTVKILADGQTRVLTKAVMFCVASHQPAGKALDTSYKTYVDAFASGTRAGMIEIAGTDKSILQSAPVYQAKDLEMMDKQADMMLAAVRASPEAGCSKLAAILESGTVESFKEATLQGHREYEAKRAAYCARVPKPTGCN
jgi:hypothetical protein